ncbi:MAG: hypothetical protein ACTSR8_20595 [Promethearchaeota archaeon]
MELYTLNEDNIFQKTGKLEFLDTTSYIIIDENVIYVWFGLKVPLSMKYKFLQEARKLNKEKGGRAKLLLINQNHEYGGFLKIKKALEQEKELELPLEHRPVIELGKPIDDVSLLKDFESQIQVEAYFISTQNHTYNELCWMLAQKQLQITLDREPSNEEIREKAEEVFKSFCTYDELCWLIAELTILQRESL